MHSTTSPARTRASIAGIGIAGALLFIAAVVLSQHDAATGAPHAVGAITSGEAVAAAPSSTSPPRPTVGPSRGPAAGEIPSGARLGPDAEVPAIRRLDPALRAALGEAQEAMEVAGTPMWITSGWRTVAYQQWLYDDAAARHGVDYARTHVATPGRTEHTTGRAADVAPTAADDWLIRNGARYGLCQTYANEIWHFELTAVGGRCPALRTDALG